MTSPLTKMLKHGIDSRPEESLTSGRTEQRSGRTCVARPYNDEWPCCYLRDAVQRIEGARLRQKTVKVSKEEPEDSKTLSVNTERA